MLAPGRQGPRGHGKLLLDQQSTSALGPARVRCHLHTGQSPEFLAHLVLPRGQGCLEIDAGCKCSTSRPGRTPFAQGDTRAQPRRDRPPTTSANPRFRRGPRAAVAQAKSSTRTSRLPAPSARCASWIGPVNEPGRRSALSGRRAPSSRSHVCCIRHDHEACARLTLDTGYPAATWLLWQQAVRLIAFHMPYKSRTTSRAYAKLVKEILAPTDRTVEYSTESGTGVSSATTRAIMPRSFGPAGDRLVHSWACAVACAPSGKRCSRGSAPLALCIAPPTAARLAVTSPVFRAGSPMATSLVKCGRPSPYRNLASSQTARSQGDQGLGANGKRTLSARRSGSSSWGRERDQEEGNPRRPRSRHPAALSRAVP